MKHQYFLFYTLSAIILMCLFSACKITSSNEYSANDTIVANHYVAIDSIENNDFKLSVTANVDLPTDDLRLILMKELLKSDSVCVDELAVKLFAKKTIEYYVNGEDEIYTDSLLHEHEEHPDISICVDVFPEYNRKGYYVVCKRKSTKEIGSGITYQERRYYNIDVEKKRIIGLADLFSEDALDELQSLLRQKLMDMNKVASEEELYEMGYFNISSLEPTGNFAIVADGIKWNYAPLEVGTGNLGEIEIFIPFEDLKRLIKTDALRI